jgi:hypothetical protein
VNSRLYREPDHAARAIEAYQVFLFDLDGTLAAEGKPLAHECALALARLLESGKHVGVVTARGVHEVGDVASQVGAHTSADALGRLRIFTSGGSLAYRPALEQRPALVLVESYVSEAQSTAVASAAARLARLPGTAVVGRGPLHTVRVMDPGAMVSVRRVLERHAVQLRTLMVSPSVLHVLPAGIGKHTAVAFYRRRLAPHASVAFGDGFYEMPELALRGNDMDFVGAATACIQVGKIKPRDPRILYLPVGADGPSSTVLVLERMRECSPRELPLQPLPPSPASTALECPRLASGLSATVHAFVSKIAEYNLTALEPDDADRRALAASGMLHEGRSGADVVRCLAESGPLERSFGRWAGFEAQYDWVLRWLWDEHLARPEVPLGAHLAERVRVPLLPEEIVISTMRALPSIARGDRVVLVGKDAECAVPLLERLVRACRASGVLPSDSLDPVGIKVSARKARGPDAIDSAEHLELGRVARQLFGLLDPEERGRPPSTRVGRRALDALLRLPRGQRRAAEEALDGCPARALCELGLGELVLRLDVQLASEFSRFVDSAREILYGVASSSLEPPDRSFAPSVESLRQLGERYESLREYQFPLTAVLAELMSETRIRRTLGARALFVDASFSTGTTLLFLRALRHIVAPDAAFRFATLGSVVLQEPLRRDLDWSGHAYLPVLLEEGAPHTFDFFYDERDERVSYTSLLAQLDAAPVRESGDARHYDTLRSEHAALFERYADLAAAGLDFGDLLRWWLRRDRVWEMRVLCDQLRFRWPYWQTVRNQRRAIALLRELDDAVGTEARARIALRDRELSIVETRRLVRDWLARHRAWIERGSEFADRVVLECGRMVCDYLADPSPAGWRFLQRTLMTKLRPAVPFG